MEIYDGREAAGKIIIRKYGMAEIQAAKQKITAPPEGDAAVKENIRR